jgi:two-component system NtrC family response regulator
MARLYDMAGRVARTDANVLLTGESGTGKRALAKAIHEAGPRAAGPYVTITCANLPAELLESELFGHEKGAFTGAHEARRGRFEQAHGGTILIDGLDELAPQLQGKLLRVVQERTFERLAGTRTIDVDVRLLSSTRMDLESQVASGRFRGDLFYRLNVVRLDLPPLRDRLEDLPALAAEMLAAIAVKHGRPAPAIAPEALELLLRHDWPGNLRELRNVLEAACIASPGDAMQAAALAFGPPGANPVGEALRDMLSLSQLEERYIREVLRRTQGRRAEAARILGINRKTLLEKRKRYGIP